MTLARIEEQALIEVEQQETDWQIEAILALFKKRRPASRAPSRRTLSRKKHLDLVTFEMYYHASQSVAKERWADNWRRGTEETDLQADSTRNYCILVAYRAIDSYAASLPVPAAIQHISLFQNDLGRVQQYASRCVVQLASRISDSPDHARISQIDPIMPWIEQAIILDREEKEEQSLDVIFDHIDEMLLASKFAECDSMLLLLPVERLTSAQLITILTATLPARPLLPNRAKFFEAVRTILRNQGADAEAILVGLE